MRALYKRNDEQRRASESSTDKRRCYIPQDRVSSIQIVDIEPLAFSNSVYLNPKSSHDSRDVERGR